MQNEYGECFSPNGLMYNPEDALNFGGVYYLTTQDGLAYKIDAKTGDLSVISDSNGNSLTFTDTSIDSSTGQRVTFDRDPQGRIIAAIDPMGNQVHYEYDAKGDLVKVIDREQNETRFVYDEPRRRPLPDRSHRPSGPHRRAHRVRRPGTADQADRRRTAILSS